MDNKLAIIFMVLVLSYEYYKHVNETSDEAYSRYLELLKKEMSFLQPIETRDMDEFINDAILSNNANEARRLILVGANIHKITYHNFTPLMLASREGFLEIVQILLEAGADPNLRSSDSALLLCISLVQPNNLEMILLLIEAGADVNARNKYSHSPLCYATQVSGSDRGSFEAVKILIRNGADINHRGDGGRTALYTAVSQGHFELVKYLLEQGADPAIVNNHGESSIALAKRAHGGMSELVEGELIRNL